MDLAERYRPKTLDDVMNQDKVLDSLRPLLKRELNEIPHAFLFTGHAGCGKTTLAYIVARELKCSSLNIEYYNTSNTRGIDTIREIDSLCRFKPLTSEGYAPIKFYILDECHELTKSAQNALLALLEKPPSHIYFALCTTEKDKLLDTIISRCTIYNLVPFSRFPLMRLIQKVCDKEGLTYDRELIKKIADASNQSARNALKIVDSVRDIKEKEKLEKAIQRSCSEYPDIFEISEIIIKKETVRWAEMCNMINKIDATAEEIRQAILGSLAYRAMSSETFPKGLIFPLSILRENVHYSGKGGLIGLIGILMMPTEIEKGEK